MPNLVPNVKVTLVTPATAVGTASITGTTLDMSGFEGVLFVLAAGAITDGVAKITAQGGALVNGTDAAPLAGTGTALSPAQSGGVAVLDLYRPLQRYITPQVVRGGATGSVIASLIAIQYGAHFKPTTQDATTVGISSLVISPTLGAA